MQMIVSNSCGMRFYEGNARVSLFPVKNQIFLL